MSLKSHPALAHSQTKDYNLAACVGFAQESWKVPDPKIPAVSRVLKAYRYNMYRVRISMIAPANIAYIAMQIQRWKDTSELTVTGTLGKEPLSGTELQSINEMTYELSRSDTDEKAAKLGTTEWDSIAKGNLAQGYQAFALFSTAQASHGAIDAMLASYIIGTWTAFEALARDLWETAVNERPAILASLEGKLSRLKKTTEARTRAKAEQDSKSIKVDYLKQFDFDLRQKMGTVFMMQRRYEFTRLSSIRAAYVEAFSTDYASIDSIICDDALDALQVTRNLLVHKAGIVDQEYSRRAKALKLPEVEGGSRMALDGPTTVRIIRDARTAGAKLITAVDTWMAKHS